ncbi:hypothetical protein DY000_02019249 [Brassica cretica]|uniref:Uncharacterized protein n=1 Tax=Brassica cretica TaxID=69181 RepID=A0ABQ7CNY7_BRACR|nr:hypothetical protein DY000_02019249 [Brassica cretica]
MRKQVLIFRTSKKLKQNHTKCENIGKGSLCRSSQARERSRQDYERSSHSHRDYPKYQNLPDPPSKSFYREVSRRSPETKNDGPSGTKSNPEAASRGIPQQTCLQPLPPEAVEEAMGEVRNAMLQYTKCADPTEREARKERL